MNHQFFYSHLIETTDVSIRLSEMKLSRDEKAHLTSLLEANIHSTVVNIILSELTEEDKKTFLKNLISDNHQETLEHLKSKIEKLEEKIKDAVEKTKFEMLEDLASAERLSQENKS